MTKPSTTTKSRNRLIEIRPIESLRRHAIQGEVFDDLNDVEIQQLADDMKRNGQNFEIEILPNGVVVCGHQRLAAAKLLGWTEIRCWIRHDLEEQGEEAVIARLIEDNLHRRQLSKLEMARCYLRVKKLRRGQPAGDDRGGDRRDQLAKRFGMSGRSLDRFAKMLEAPIEIQRAYDRGELKQRQVLAITRLDPDVQQQIADRITEGEAPDAVVKEYSASKKHANPSSTSLTRFVKASQQFHRDFDGGVEDVVKQLKAADKKALRGARRVITRLIGKPKPNNQKGHRVKKEKKHREGTK